MILAGGTGGHVYPALAVAQDLVGKGHRVTWMGTRSGLEARVVPAAGIPVEWLTVTGLRGKGWRRQLMAPFMLLRALWQARAILHRCRPGVVLGMGGFVAGPGGIMARWLRIPLLIHEQNRVPGTTNRLLARFASRVLEAFPGTFPPAVGALCTGNPLRAGITGLTKLSRQEPGSARRLLVVGGSLGARVLNEVVPQALAQLGTSLEIRHQTGPAMQAETAAAYGRLGVRAEVLAYIEDMAEAYAWADLVICRAGAMTISELAAAGLPAILIPYPHAIDDHQTRNAEYLAAAAAATLLPQAELSPPRLADELRGLISNWERLSRMAANAAALAKPDATRVVAALCLEQAAA